MKFTKIFSMTALLSVLLSTNVFAKELSSSSLGVVYNESEGALKIYNKAVFKGNGTPEGNAFAKKCNELEQKRVDKYVESKKYDLEHRHQLGMINSVKPEYAKIFAHARKLHQECRTLSEKMVKEGCFRR